MKKDHEAIASGGRKWRKMTLIMKLKFILLLFMSVQLSAAVHSQTAQVTLKMSNVTLEQVLWEIQKQTDFVFMYGTSDIAGVTGLNVDMASKTVEEILDYCLKGTKLRYEMQGNAIVLRRRNEEKEEKVMITVKGKVTDEKKQPLPGVTVRLKGTAIGVATEADGRYEIMVPRDSSVLIFSFVGMLTQEKKVGKDLEINVILKEDVKNVDEVVITGYANIRKESFTGNATTVSKDKLLKTNNKNVIEALQHFDPSFRIKENSLWGSDPNALPEFNIRGESSIAMRKGLDVEAERLTQRTNLQDNPNLPIFILDGFEVSVQKIYDMDINRIESITILKDAAATVLYGSRAANGVVVVTTVAPKPGEIQITYNLTGGFEFPDLSDYNLCNASEKLEVERLAGVYKYDDPDLQVEADINYNKKMALIQRGVNTDWMSQPLRNVFNHTHSLNIQGGVESIRYSFDLNYDSNHGAMKGSRRSRAGAGLTLDYRNGDWLQILNSFSYRGTNAADSPYGSFSIYANMQPYLPIFDEEGELLKVIPTGIANSMITNPLWKVENLRNYSGKKSLDDFTESLSVNLFLVNGIQFKGQFSVTKTIDKVESFVDPADPSKANFPQKERGSLSRVHSESLNWNVNALFYYNKIIKKHFVNATVGINASESKSETTNITWEGFQLGTMNKPAFAAQQSKKATVTSNASRLFGILASMNYSYNDVYLLDVSFRLDGSSQFGEDKRFAPFWSLGVGINIHNYSWLKDNWLINTLRLRLTYGSTGKVNFPSYTAVTTYKTDTDKWYFTGPSAKLIYLGNPNLTWETTKTWDAGFVVGMLQDRLYLDFTYYHKQTDDLIDQVAIRESSGFSTRYTNMGSILNEGVELNMNTIIVRNNDWMVTLTANLASNKNTIVKLGKEMEEYNKTLLENYENERSDYPEELRIKPLIQYHEGASTTAIYAVRSAGIDPANGKERFIKKNGLSSYIWCADDQVVVGDNNPSIQGSFGINIGFKGFYFNASFLYQWGGQTYNETLLNKVENADIVNSNVDKRVLTERWKKPGDVAPYYDLKNNTRTQPTSRFVQDYNNLSFSSLSCGYDFKKEIISKFYLISLGLRFNANDICRWSSVKEERGTSYPYTKNYSFTVSIGF